MQISTLMCAIAPSTYRFMVTLWVLGGGGGGGGGVTVYIVTEARP